MAAGAFADSVALESSAGKQQTEANQGNHVSAPNVLQALQRQLAQDPNLKLADALLGLESPASGPATAAAPSHVVLQVQHGFQPAIGIQGAPVASQLGAPLDAYAPLPQVGDYGYLISPATGRPMSTNRTALMAPYFGQVSSSTPGYVPVEMPQMVPAEMMAGRLPHSTMNAFGHVRSSSFSGWYAPDHSTAQALSSTEQLASLFGSSIGGFAGLAPQSSEGLNMLADALGAPIQMRAQTTGKALQAADEQATQTTERARLDLAQPLWFASTSFGTKGNESNIER